MYAFLKVLAVILVLTLSLLLVRTNQLLWTTNQTVFSGGSIGDALPDGSYTGSLDNFVVSWEGKKFDRASRSGINLFSGANRTTIEKYPFSVSTGEGVHDRKSVIRIDYNIAGNPLWLRPVLDELVLVAPGVYLGKLELRLVPGYPFTLVFFKLVAKQ